MAQYVINEWFWADLSDENGELAQQQTFTLLRRFAESNDQLVLVNGSAFDRKAWAFCGSQFLIRQLLGRAFVRLIRSNSNRCLVIYEHELVHLPNELARIVKPDDQYLVRACLTVSDSILISTDRPLIDVLSRHGLQCISREQLLARFSI